MGTIVVGVDGSAGSDGTLRWALNEARLRGTKLRVVHVYQPPQLPLTEVGVGAAGGMGVPVFAENADEFTSDDYSTSRKLRQAGLGLLDPRQPRILTAPLNLTEMHSNR